MLQTYCHRELTKKSKFYGLTNNSWLALAIISVLTWFFFILWAIPMAILLYTLFWLLEYFDEDIYTIISSKNKIKSKKYYA